MNCPKPPTAKGVRCSYHGEDVTVSTGSFDATAALRHKACDEGYINKGYLVATDGQNLTIAPDYNATAQRLAKVLELEVVPYCS